MTLRYDIAQKELTKKNELQDFLSEQNDDVYLYSMFLSDDLVKFSRASRFDQKLNSSNSDNDFIFKVPESTHFLVATDICQELPTIMVREEFQKDHRMSWTPKTLIYMIEKAQLYAGEEPIGQPLTSHSLDQFVEFLGPRVWKQEYDEIIENCQGDIGWSSESIEGKPISLPQPFLYNGQILKALKRILIPKVELSFKYTFRRDIRQLIRLQKLENNKWVDCVDSSEMMDKILFSSKDVSVEGILKSPELWGSFAIINKEEVTKWEDLKNSKKYIDQIQEFVQVSCDEIKGSGTINIDLKEPGCVRGIFWSIQNLDEVDKHNYFIYTSKGKDTVINSSMKYEKDAWVDLSSYHHSRRLPRHAGLRTPRTSGYHYQPIAFDGVLLEGADTQDDLLQLSAKLKLSYKLEGRGQPLIFLDMHRLVNYNDGKIQILVDKGPGLE